MNLLRLCFVALLLPLSAHTQTLTVFAAASLTNALQDIGVIWQARGHGKVIFSFASSAVLARQIVQGAPANIFASADERWMDAVDKTGALAAATREDLLGNVLVLAEPKAALRPVALTRNTDLGAILGPDGRLAVGDPGSVPAGIYARQALESLGLWELAKNRLAASDSVRSALRLVELGEAPAAIVYATDVVSAPKVGVAGTFPPGSHDPIRYPFAVLRAGDTPAARAFLAFLKTPPAQDVFHHYGFPGP